MMKLPNDFCPTSDAKVFETKSTLFWFIDGLQYVYCKPNELHTLEHAKKQIEQLLIYSKEMNQPIKSILCDTRSGTPLSKEVRDFYSSEQSQSHTKKFAFIVDSALSRVMANFFINLRKMSIPIKMFTDIGEAKKWSNS